MPASPPNLAPLDTALGHVFADATLLQTALTPSSSGLLPNNQRLEFLGDSILQFCASNLVFRAHPDWAEGDLTKLRGMIVCTEALRDWAEALALPLRRGPRSPRKPAPGGQRKPLADAMEAVLAALFLDVEAQGGNGMDAVSQALQARFGELLQNATPEAWTLRDSKTALQEQAARKGLPAPSYQEISRKGPDHSPRFRVRVGVGTQQAEGEGGTLKAAQAEAARCLLQQLDAVPQLP